MTGAGVRGRVSLMRCARRSGRAVRVVVMLAVVCAGARGLLAAEHITLRNGFELNCDHRSAAVMDGEKVRLYLDAGGANYVDVHPADIVSAEWMEAEAVVAPDFDTGTSDKAAAPKADAAGVKAEGATSLPSLVARGTPVASVKAELSPAELHELLAGAGAEHDIDVDLLASLVHAESGSHARAVSRAGAQGLMQLMPGTAAQLGVHASFAPEDNVHGGTAYLDSLLKLYHDNLALALAAYNAGPGAVDRYHGVPPYRETRAYVARIIHEFNQRYTARQAAASLAMAK